VQLREHIDCCSNCQKAAHDLRRHFSWISTYSCRGDAVIGGKNIDGSSQLQRQTLREEGVHLSHDYLQSCQASNRFS
jgi:hypothetical protein